MVGNAEHRALTLESGGIFTEFAAYDLQNLFSFNIDRFLLIKTNRELVTYT